jgi:DNA-binding transcriptional MerR regulator
MTATKKVKLEKFLQKTSKKRESMLNKHEEDIFFLRENGATLATIKEYLESEGVAATIPNLSAFIRRRLKIKTQEENQKIEVKEEQKQTPATQEKVESKSTTEKPKNKLQALLDSEVKTNWDGQLAELLKYRKKP